MSDEKDITIRQSIANKVIQLKYWWKGDHHSAEIGTDCCGNELEYDPLIKAIVSIEAFHHLSHEGMTFIHGERHDALADSASLDVLIRIPAGNPDRQVHLRFDVHATSAGTLDIDAFLYRSPTTSADGAVGDIISTNDAIVKTSGVLMFMEPTVTDVGTYMTSGVIFGEKRSANSEEAHVPEWILAPDGNNSRDYLFRMTNNSGAAADILHHLFFYDSEAV